MLFDHKPVEQLTESELRTLLGVRENEHVEFKVSYCLFGADPQALNEEKYELLKDIASMANAGGGYIFVGVRANEKSVGVKFESIDSKNLERLKQVIMALCVDHIEERISGLEVKDRIVDGANIIIIRVPNSLRIPHMVKYLNNTHFTKRYQDGKREMSLAEIRFTFNNDLTERRLALIEQLLLRGEGRHGSPTQGTDYFADNSLNEIRDGQIVASNAIGDFVKTQPEPAVYFGVGPRHPVPRQLDLSSKQLSEFLQTLSREDRNLGWNMNLVDRRRLEKNSAKVTMGKPENASISLLANGYMSFQMPLNENFCWPQSDEEFKKRPRFSSYAVVEFPVSFFRMYRRLIDTFGISDNEWCVACCYHKAEGYFLAPGHPMSPFFDVGDAKMYSSSEDLVITDVIPGQFVSDAISYALLSKVYASFGLDERSIPFYLDQQSVFDIN